MELCNLVPSCVVKDSSSKYSVHVEVESRASALPGLDQLDLPQLSIVAETPGSTPSSGFSTH